MAPEFTRGMKILKYVNNNHKKFGGNDAICCMLGLMQVGICIYATLLNAFMLCTFN